MIIRGRVIDGARRSSVQDATVTVLDSMGKPVGVSTVTDGVGGFSMNSPLIVAGHIVSVSHPNYNTQDTAIVGAADLGFITLTEKALGPIDPVITSGGLPWWGWALLIGGGMYALSKSKKSRR